MSAGRVGRLRVAGVVIACCLGSGLLTASNALAEETRTFVYTGKEQPFTVPVGVTSVHVLATGASGAEGLSIFTDESPGGLGAKVSGNFAVTPGQVLNVEVGGAPNGGAKCYPGVQCLGGFNGGGKSVFGGGGGGASDVRTVSIGAEPSPGNEASLESRQLVAAGGGGGGAENPPFCLPPFPAGGHGGNAQEKGGDGQSCDPPLFGHGGGAGTGAEGGAGGSEFAAQGGFGTGGGGLNENGGGGGGGLYGGGEGGDLAEEVGAAGGGGGGSNLVPNGGTSAIAEAGAEPSVAISYTARTTLFFPYSARPSGSIPFVVKAVTLETVGKRKIRCLSREGSFVVKTEYSMELALHMYSCTSNRRPCYTTGPGEANQPQGQMYLEFLGELVSINKEKHQVGVLFSPSNNGSPEEIHVSCRESPNDNIGGQVLARISPVNKVVFSPASFSLRFAQKVGVQNPSTYEVESAPVTLTTQPEGGESEQTGFAFSSGVTFSEPLLVLD